MEDKIFDIVTDLLRHDISKTEAIDKLLILHNVSKSVKCKECNDSKKEWSDFLEEHIGECRHCC